MSMQETLKAGDPLLPDPAQGKNLNSTRKGRNCLLWPLVNCAARDCNKQSPGSRPDRQECLHSGPFPGPSSEYSLTGFKESGHERCPSKSRACRM